MSFAAALKAAGVEGYVRPFHDLRHTAITNDATAGASPAALMAKAGHGSMSTTQTYLHLAGVPFREEADALARRLLGSEVSAEAPRSFYRTFYPPRITSELLSQPAPACHAPSRASRLSAP